MSQGIIGSICHSQEKHNELFDWKLENFLSLSNVCCHYYESPTFNFAEATWCLQLYPNGRQPKSEGRISLFIRLVNPTTSKQIHYTLGVKSPKGNLEQWKTSLRTFDKNIWLWGAQPTKIHTKVLRRKIELSKLKCITFTTSMTTFVPRLFRGVEKVSVDFGNLLRSGDNSDVIVHVGDVQFNAHKVILAARTPVLAAMFQHDTAENISNRIFISDCEPHIFKEFLHYLYTGTVQDLTVQNVFGLYCIADKYLVDELKLQCSMYIEDTLCVDTFCDTVLMALTRREKKLVQIAVAFALKNMQFILPSVKWQNFIQEHPLLANQMLIKS